jgi:hypothetical protein
LYPTQPSCLDQVEMYTRGKGARREAGN